MSTDRAQVIARVLLAVLLRLPEDFRGRIEVDVTEGGAAGLRTLQSWDTKTLKGGAA
jgi:hypothetical protein